MERNVWVHAIGIVGQRMHGACVWNCFRIQAQTDLNVFCITVIYDLYYTCWPP